MRTAVLVGLLTLAGCTVPDVALDGRPCPCVPGWVCDAVTTTCVRPGAPADAGHMDTGTPPTDAGDLDAGITDGGGLDSRADSGLVTTIDGNVTPLDGGGCYFRDDFDDGRLVGWTTPAGTWREVGGEAVQDDDSLGRAFAFADATDGSTDFRVRARFRQIRGTPGGAIEVNFRVNPTTHAQYFCNYEPNQADMVMMVSDAIGDSRSLGELSLEPADIPGYDPFGSFTMILEVRGGSFRCWIDEVPGTEMTVFHPRYRSGAIGMKTYQMSAAYDWLEVCPVD